MPIERILEAENIAEGAGSGPSVSSSSVNDAANASNDIRLHPGFAGDVENQV